MDIPYIYSIHNKLMKRLKIDLHIHTNHSKDGKMSPEDLVRKAKNMGFDAIAVTDHGTIKGAVETERIAKRIAKDMIVIVGQEVNTDNGEILAYGIREDIKEEEDIVKTCKEIKQKNGFLIIPHPFDPMRKGAGKRIAEVMEYADAVEGFNERTIVSRFNDKSMAFVRENGVSAVAGSDAHFLEEFGKTYMLIDSKKETKDILEAIKEGKAELFMEKHGKAYEFKRGLKKIKTYF